MLHTLELCREDSSLTGEGGDPVGEEEGAADSDDICLVRVVSSFPPHPSKARIEDW